MTTRYIDNELRDFQPPGKGKQQRRSSKARKADAIEDVLLHSALRLSLQRILRETPPADAARSRDYSVYTGTAGYCLLFLVLHSRGIGFGVGGRTGQLAGYSSPLELAAAYLDAAQACMDKQIAKRGAAHQGFTFLTGAAGVHAVGAAVAQRTGDLARCRRHAREVAAMEELALSDDEPRSHDVLNGLAGFLSALLFVRANTRVEIGEEEVPDQLLLRVVDRIVSDGVDAPSAGRWSSPNSPSSATLTHDEENGPDKNQDKDHDGGGEEETAGGDGDKKASTTVAAPSSGSGHTGGGGSGGGTGSSRSNGGGGGAARADDNGGEREGESKSKSKSRRGDRGGRRRGGKGRKGGSSGGDAALAAAAAAAAAAEAEKAEAEAAAAAAARAGTSNSMEYGVLTYEWHAKMYLGAARGVSGILYVLMQALQTVYGASLLVEARAGDGDDTEDLPPQAAEQLYLIRSTVDAVVNTVLPEGNFPSTPVSADDRLVQWCHGAPGVIPMLTKAHEVFEDDRYLDTAKRSSEVVWKRGLLTKGNGICHGVAGNGYAFLCLKSADATDGQHLNRARGFAGFTASAVLGPDHSAGANAFRDDPFGPGAHAQHPRGGGYSLGRSSSHDTGRGMPSAGWPSHNGTGSSGNNGSSGGGNTHNNGGGGSGGGGGSVNGGGAGGPAGSRAAAGGRSHSVGSGGGSSGNGEVPSQAVPDRPMSLFEGLAGAAAFLADCCVSEAGAGEGAWFPALQLPS